MRRPCCDGAGARFALLALAAAAPCGATRPFNTLFLVVDNLRPALGAYGVPEVITPRIDRFARGDGAVLFSRAFCQLAWCSPSRNSFLTGRRPQTTLAFNFVDSFRRAGTGAPGPGAGWVTMPGYFNRSGVYATSSGKVFHPNLPADFDFPQSWSDVPAMQEKCECAVAPPDGGPPPKEMYPVNMTCEFVTIPPGSGPPPPPGGPGPLRFRNADAETADAVVDRLRQWRARPDGERPPFFAAAGFQGPRLSWSYPYEAGALYPDDSKIPLPAHPDSPPPAEGEGAEWFRPTEVAWYKDVRDQGGVTHARPLSPAFQRRARRGYYAAITNVDTQVGALLDELVALGVDDDTVVVLTADHAQNLGEFNMWSMMNLLETSLRVPLVIRPAPSDPRFHKGGSGAQPPAAVYPHPVELVDLFPTLVSLARLPPPPASYGLEGDDLVPGMLSGGVAKRVGAAFGQITRCRNCTESYSTDAESYRGGCAADAVDAKRFFVPCAHTNRTRFDYMGMTVRTPDWRYTVFCAWNGTALRADFARCGWHELYDHRNDTALYDVDHNGEDANVVNASGNDAVRAQLDTLLRAQFDRGSLRTTAGG